MNRSKKVFSVLAGSLLFLSPLTVNASALNKSAEGFSKINIYEEIKEKSILEGLPKMIVFLSSREIVEIDKTIKAIRKLRSQVERKLRSGADLDKGMPQEIIKREMSKLKRVVGKYDRRWGHPLIDIMFKEMQSLDRSVKEMIRESEKLKKVKKVKKAGLNADCVAFNDPLLKPWFKKYKNFNSSEISVIIKKINKCSTSK